jgi:mRNA interferase MazF
MNWPLLRGQVIRVEIGLPEPKLFLVVSNNRRNRQLPQVLAARLTTTPKPTLTSVVEIIHPEVFIGRVVCDDIVEIYEEDVIQILGGLTASTMQQVSIGLAAALDIRVN